MSGAEKLVEQIIKTLNENKAVDIVKIDLRRIENCFCSFFVICHGTSNTHVASLTDFVYDEVNEKVGEKPLHVEGEQQAQWVVLDYGNVVVHIFQKEQRDYYQLELILNIAENNKKDSFNFPPVGGKNNKGPKFGGYWSFIIIAAFIIGIQFFSMPSNPERISWQKFKTDLLAKGEVKDIYIVRNGG